MRLPAAGGLTKTPFVRMRSRGSGAALGLLIACTLKRLNMEDSRCCGTGTCIINEDGQCWCGQRWDGTRMCFPEPVDTQADGEGSASKPRSAPAGDEDSRH